MFIWYCAFITNGPAISGYSHISEPALELYRRVATSVRGNITALSVLTQGEIPEEGRYKKKPREVQIFGGFKFIWFKELICTVQS